MNALARFEGFMQELMDRRVVRLLGGALQPIELANGISRTMESEAVEGLAPDCYELLVHPEDSADLRALDRQLERKLAEYSVEAARERSLNFLAAPEVHLVADRDIERGRVSTRSSFTHPIPVREPRTSRRSAGRPRTAAAAAIRLEMPNASGSTSIPIQASPFTIGRRPGNHLVLPDPSVSREHALVEAVPDGYRVRDLSSRNGTLLNGEPISEADLRDGDRLAIGSFEVVVRIDS